MKLNWRNSLTLTRLAGEGLFNIRLLIWSYVLLLPIQVIFDVVGYRSPSWMWLWVWTQGHIIMTIIAIPMRFFIVDPLQQKYPNPFTNLLAAGVLGIARVTTIGYLSYTWGLVSFFDLEARIVAGFLLGTIFFAFMTNITESTKGYRESLAALLRTQNRLNRLRRVTKETLAEEQIRVQKQAKSVIEPKLQEIAQALMNRKIDSSSKKSLANEISQLLEQEVKPLNASLRETSKALEDNSVFRRANRLSLYRFPDLVRPHLALRPALSLLIFLIVIPFSLYIFADESWITLGQFIGLMCAVLIFLAKQGLSKLPPMPLWPAAIILLLVALSPVALMYFMLERNDFPLHLMPNILLVVGFVSVAGGIGYALVEIHDYNRETFLEQVEQDNMRIERELALINQKMWVQRRFWALALHGTVQASLTAALARLNSSKKLTAKEVTEIKKHIAQARLGLLPKLKGEFDFKKAMNELRRTWNGIIDVKIDTRSEASKRLTRDTWASICANEIVKEAVSNAMRHGKATAVEVKFEMNQRGFIDITSTNNGRPVPNSIDQGLGSQLLDEITHTWSLGQEATGAVLRARIPVTQRGREKAQSMSRRKDVTKAVTAKTAP